jgi:hypothetical protein
MRTAICFHGQPRFYDEMYDHIWKNLIEKYKADVFIHTYWSTSHVGELYPVRVLEAFNEEDIKIKEDSIEKLTELYKPVSIEYDWYDSIKINKHQTNYYQYYTQYAVKNLKCEHEQQNNFKYDMIIRARLDYACRRLDYDLDLSYLWVPDTCPNETLYTDAFSVSNSEYFDKISDCYINLDSFELCGHGTTEYALKEQITLENIPINKIPMKADVLRSNRIALGEYFK